MRALYPCKYNILVFKKIVFLSCSSKLPDIFKQLVFSVLVVMWVLSQGFHAKIKQVTHNARV